MSSGRGARSQSDGVVEGVGTARSVPQLARRLGVEMPICESLYAVLFEGKPAVEAGRELMARAAPERGRRD